MVASVAERGFEATRVADLVEASGVSSRSFYDLFPNKESCFVAALEEVLEASTVALERAGASEVDWAARVRAMLAAFVEMVISQPAASKLILSDAYAAGPAALELVERSVAGFEALSRSRLTESPERAGMPEEMIVAEIGALQETARSRLRRDQLEDLRALLPELVTLIAGYRPPPAPLRLATRPPSFGPESTEAHDDADRALRAFALVVAEHGFAGATIHEVAKRGSMSPTTFYANFRDKHDALLAAIDSLMAQLATAATTAFRRGPGWAPGIRAAVGSLLSFLASRPAMARLLLVDIYAGGEEALERRAQGAAPLAALLAGGHLAAPGVPSVAAEAIGGGLASLLRRQLLASGPESLPALAPICTYIALSPFIGPEAAAEAANGDGRGRLPEGTEAPLVTPSMPTTKWTLLTVLAARPTTAATLASGLGTPLVDIEALLDELETEGLLERVGDEEHSETVWSYRPYFRLLDGDDWARLTPAERETISNLNLKSSIRDLEDVLKTGAVHRNLDSHISRLVVAVDEEGWLELGEIHRSACNASRAVQLRSAERLRESGEAPLFARSLQSLFEIDEADAEERGVGEVPPA